MSKGSPGKGAGRIPHAAASGLGRALRREIPRRWVRNLLLASGGLFCLALGFSVAGLQYLARDLPSPASIEAIEPPVNTVVLSAAGDTLRQFYRENRTLVPLSRIPRRLQEAVIAIEDRRFYDHYGIDPRRILKIIWVNLSSGSRPGASTLTQQLARNLFLTPEKTVTRKLKEIVLALQIEQTYTKDEILTMYLNQIYLGHGAYGMQAAARTFFGKNVWDLQDAESTLLAGVIQNPGRHSPFFHLEQSYRRRGMVLDAMVQSGFLSRAEADTIGATEVHLVDPQAQRASADFAAYFVEEVRQELERRYGVDGLYGRGLRVTTTLVPRYQHWLEEGLEKHVRQLEREQGYEMTKARWDTLSADGQAPAPTYLQAAGLLVDVRTGAVLAMVGGRSFQQSKFNRAVQAPRQPGSIFKPFVYLTALERGYTPATVLMDTPFVIDTGTGLWRPKNFSGRFEGPMSVRYALSHSVNVPTAKLYLDFGVTPVIENVRRLGVREDLPRVPSLFLGAGELTLQEVVGAYATFANAGVRAEPYLIERVETAQGEVLQEARVQQHEVLDPAVAYVLTNVLTSTLEPGGTAQSARWRGFKATGAGKTGTTNDCTNAWFCGYTPSYCAGVWVGFDENVSMGKSMTGARAALPIWVELMSRIAAEKGDEPFPRPASIVERTICADTGKLATSRCDSVRTEVFLPDNYPQELCDRHGGQLLDLRGLDRDFESLDRRHSDGGLRR